MTASRRIALFTLTKDRVAYTERMFRSLEKSTHIPYDHIVIDNGSVDGTIDFLKKKPGRVVQAIYNSDNKGLSIAWNQALDRIGTDYDYIIKVDNDCEIISDNWLAPILDIMEAFDRKIILSPFVAGLSEHKGGVRRHAKQTVNGHQVGLTKHLGGISLVAPTAAYDGFRFNEKLPLRGGQDVTFSAHIGNIGYLMGYVEDISVFHMDTTDGQQEKYPDYFEARETEAKKVYGENLVITALKYPYRRRLRRKLVKSIKKGGHDG